MRNLSKWDFYAQLKKEFIQSTLHHNLENKRFKALALIVYFVSMFSLLSQAQPAKAQAVARDIKERKLEVGDTIPKELWELSLQTVNHPSGKKNILLQDFQKKLIILDFWATWCGSCISAFPKTKMIEKQFSENLQIIPITTQDQKLVSKFMANNDLIKDNKIWSIVNAKEMEKYFTIHTLPHYVWIFDNKVVSFSTSNALTIPFIEKFLSRSEKAWVEKVALDKRLPFIESIKNFGKTSFYYEGKVEGAGKSFGIYPYQKDLTNYYFTNQTKHEIISWFIAKLRKDIPIDKIHITAPNIAIDTEEWQKFIKEPTTTQLIVPKTEDLQSVFDDWLKLARINVLMVEERNVTISIIK
ncbi:MULTISPECIES: TlpA family protein disulfide reductase [Sphingobacterium]|jgi:thiol-disulfide isomerase/thioredoxin|uniref:TlpA family protein disulfide reductase n=1 Tax=Sphingobacterium TaxID=28453 RepID=UPI0028AB2B3A|nr:thioredoxin domain-containing protein [Sphingobacterium multivorum]